MDDTTVPPIGMPTLAGNFINPTAFRVANTNLLPPQGGTVVMTTIVNRKLQQDAQAGAFGLAFNAANKTAANSVPMVQTTAISNVGQAGTLGLQGATASATPVGRTVAPGATMVRAVDAVSQWQLNHPTLDGWARFGLPIAALILWRRGFDIAAGAVAAPAAYLWYNRLRKR
jgi:hypothetical protein